MASGNITYQDDLKRTHIQSFSNTVATSLITVALPAIVGMTWIAERVSLSTDLSGNLTVTSNGQNMGIEYNPANTTKDIVTPITQGALDDRGWVGGGGFVGLAGYDLTFTLQATTQGSLNVNAIAVLQRQFSSFAEVANG